MVLAHSGLNLSPCRQMKSDGDSGGPVIGIRVLGVESLKVSGIKSLREEDAGDIFAALDMDRRFCRFARACRSLRKGA